MRANACTSADARISLLAVCSDSFCLRLPRPVLHGGDLAPARAPAALRAVDRAKPGNAALSGVAACGLGVKHRVRSRRSRAASERLMRGDVSRSCARQTCRRRGRGQVSSVRGSDIVASCGRHPNPWGTRALDRGSCAPAHGLGRLESAQKQLIPRACEEGAASLGRRCACRNGSADFRPRRGSFVEHRNDEFARFDSGRCLDFRGQRRVLGRACSEAFRGRQARGYHPSCSLTRS